MIKHKGFTFIELVVVLAIIATLAVMAAPNYFNMAAVQDMNKSAIDLSSTLQKAQSRAILEGSPITVYLGSTPPLASNEMSWMPSGNSIFVGGPQTVFVGKNGFLQTSATDKKYYGVLQFLICSSNVDASRKVTYNRIGVITTTEAMEGCNAS